MAENKRHFACGVTCVYTESANIDDFRATLAAERNRGHFGFALVFFSKTAITGSDVVTMMAKTCPGLDYAACSTAGEITPAGMTEGQIVAILFPGNVFRIRASRISGLNRNSIEDIVSQVGDAKRRFLKGISGEPGNSIFAMCLMDGMSFMEEAPGSAWRQRQQLAARLGVLFRAFRYQPAAVFSHLLLVALDVERLRGDILQRRLFPSYQEESA